MAFSLVDFLQITFSPIPSLSLSYPHIHFPPCDKRQKNIPKHINLDNKKLGLSIQSSSC